MKWLSTETRQDRGKVQVGDSDGTTEVELSPGKKKETLEVNLGNGVKFSVTFSLLLNLSGIGSDAKPELSNFKFAQFTVECRPGTFGASANMPNMLAN